MTGHIFIEGEIGDQINTKSVRSDIAQYPKATNWNIHINSPGGDVDEGYAIGSILKNLPNTTAIIGSTCASIATYDAHCCDHIIMNPSGDFTIHLPTAIVGGNAQDHLNAAARLERIKSELINRYMTRVAKKGVTSDQVSAMIDKETSMSPQEALDMGFVDDVQEKFKAVAKLDLKKYTMETLSKEETLGLFTGFGKKLDALIKSLKPENKIEKPIAKIKVKSKPKNSIDLTLTDGTILQCDAEDPNNLQGATVSNQDGTPVVDGTYETADGLEIEVVNGTITEAEQEPTNESEDNPSEDTDPNLKNDDSPMETYDELMAQLETVQKKLMKAKPGAQPVTAAPAAKAKVGFKATNKAPIPPQKTAYENKIEELENQIAELKKMTVGDSNPPSKQPLALNHEEEYDESFMAFSNAVTDFALGRGFIERKN